MCYYDSISKLLFIIKNAPAFFVFLSDIYLKSFNPSLHKFVLLTRNRARSLVVSELRSETNGSRFEYGC